MRLKIAVGIVLCLVALLGMFLAQPKPVGAQATFAPFQCSNSVAVSSAANVQVVTAANSSMLIYVCGFVFNSIAATQFSFVEGTGTTCATNSVALTGSTTPATGGFGVAANGSPITAGAGVGWVLKTKTPGDNLCIFVSGTGPLAGSFVSTQANF